MFSPVPPSVNQYDFRNEIISTRIFIILLILSFTILLLYNSLLNIKNTIYIEKPTFEEYKRLYRMYPEIITCPCTKIATNYQEFLEINYTLHQLCTSTFVTEEWILYLARNYFYQSLYADDFLLSGASTFQALITVCQMANRTISNSLIQFYSTQYVSATVTPLETFNISIQPLVDQFISSTTNNFLLSFDLIRNTTAVNHIMSASQSNYFFRYGEQNSMKTFAASYRDCWCHHSAKCIASYSVKSHPMVAAAFLIPNFYMGCYIIEALLQSTLECFYDQICISYKLRAALRVYNELLSFDRSLILY